MNSYVGRNRSGLMVIVLSIMTCSLYLYYWLYMTMEDINRALEDEKFKSTPFLLLCIFIPGFILFVYYKINKNLLELCDQTGVEYKGNYIMWLLLYFACGAGIHVANYQIAEALNSVWVKRNGIADTNEESES